MKKPVAQNNSDNPPVLIPQQGERALVLGQTGSGKTAFVTWLLRRVTQSPILIYDTKEEPKFNSLPYSTVAVTVQQVQEQINKAESDYIIFRPPPNLTVNPQALDALLSYHYYNFRGIPAYIDEIYSFHARGVAGPGLVALLTRGRSRGITVIMSTQRPSWLSMFAITETQRFYIFKLSYRLDRKKVSEVIPDFEDMPQPPKHGFYFFQQGEDRPMMYGPVKLESGTEQGYTDVIASDASGAHASRVLWV